MLNREQLKKDLQLVRTESPLVQNITNYVAMNFTANCLLAVGASPIMAHAPEEVEDIVKIAGALVLNIGTLDSHRTEGMLIAGKTAHLLGKPIILDPVGVGATHFRAQTAWKIINECQPTIIRGNSSEIIALVNSEHKSKGVDTCNTASDAITSANILAERTKAIVVVSGETDYITDGKRVSILENGSPLMTKVTAMGCTSSSIIGAFAAINPDPFEAALHGMSVMGVCGERAAQKKAAPGSLAINFIDELYLIPPTELADAVREKTLQWTDTAWQAASTIIHNLQQHPFIRRLKDGSLPKDSFIHYLEQDMIYLTNYGKEMEMLSHLMPTTPMKELFRKIAADGVLAEKELHQFLSTQWDAHPTEKVSSCTQGYMNFTRHYIGTGDAALAIASLLPCFWVYNEIGHFIAATPPTDEHPYKAWIETYKSAEMDEVVEQVIFFANQLAQECSPEKQATMRNIFVEATHWEYEFFNQN